MINQHWFREWLGAVRQQAITWNNIDPNLFYYMASPGHNVLTYLDPWGSCHKVPLLSADISDLCHVAFGSLSVNLGDVWRQIHDTHNVLVMIILEIMEILELKLHFIQVSHVRCSGKTLHHYLSHWWQFRYLKHWIHFIMFIKYLWNWVWLRKLLYIKNPAITNCFVETGKKSPRLCIFLPRNIWILKWQKIFL